MSLSDQINKAPGSAPGGVSATVTSTEIVPENTNRQWLFLTNIGANDVFVAIGQAAVLNTGMVLRSPDGALFLDAMACPGGAINGITAAGTSLVIFQESE